MFNVIVYVKNYNLQEVEARREEVSGKGEALDMALQLTGKFKRFTRVEIIKESAFWKGYGDRDALIEDIWNSFLAVIGTENVLPEDWLIFKKGTKREDVVSYINVCLLP